MQIADSVGFIQGVEKSLNLLGSVYLKKGDLDLSLEHSSRALELSLEHGNIKEIRDAAKRIYELHKLKNNAEDALKAYELYMAMNDSLKSEENKKAIIRQEFEYRYEKQALADSLEFAQKEALLNETNKRQQLGLISALVGLFLLIALAGAIFIGKKRSEILLNTVSEQHEELKVEKKRGDDLLLNILPEKIASELMTNDVVKARKHETVTVLFTDFQGFTELASSIEAEQLVDEINTCFSAFDYLTSKFEVEKIKTIGDAYMAAAGFNEDPMNASLKVVHFGLRIQRFMKKHNQKRIKMGLNPLEMRVGIHTGPVVAGIVGIKKFQYDIWGDTVNTAARMESSGEAGKVNISESTYDLIKEVEEFAFKSRGKIAAKGKGELEMYFVEQKV